MGKDAIHSDVKVCVRCLLMMVLLKASFSGDICRKIKFGSGDWRSDEVARR